jgi:putative membrane protein
MQVDFSQPQRQSVVGVLVLFLDTVRHFGKALWPILVVWFFKFKALNPLYLIVGMLGILLVFGIVAYLKYLNFTFFLDKEHQEFVVTEGIFNKTKTTIQLRKIQQVTIRQSFIQKIIGVHTLDVDTAGASKTEVAIRAISHDFAVALKAHLLDNETNGAIVSDEIPADFHVDEIGRGESPFIKISFLSLLKVGVSANYVKSFFILLAFFITLYDNVKRIFGESTIDESMIDSYFDKNGMMEIVPIVIFGLFFVILVMNVLRMVFKYFDFRITKQAGSLLLSFGLLNTKSTILKPEKVQIVMVSCNYFQKKMNVLEMKIKQATSGGEREEHKGVIAIPGCNDIEQSEILRLLFSKIPVKGVVLKPNFRSLGFSLFLTIGLPLFVFCFLRDVVVSQFPASDMLAVFYVVLVGVIQFCKYSNSHLFVSNEFIMKQSGAWDISTEIIEPDKIQAITTSQFFWHKNLNIGSVTLHTAGGNIAFQLGDYLKIKQYVNLWLCKIETSDRNWM